MFTTTHDIILLILAAMWTIGFLVQVSAFNKGRIAQASGVPLYLAVALVITAVLW